MTMECSSLSTTLETMPARSLLIPGALLLTAAAAHAEYEDVPRDRKERPERMEYKEGAPVPRGYHVDRHDGLVIAGSVTFGLMYGLSVWGAASGKDLKALYIPIAGPIIYGSTYKGFPAGLGEMVMMVMIVDALVQASGVAMFVVGMRQKTELVRNDVARVHVTPIVTPTQAGLGFGGVF